MFVIDDRSPPSLVNSMSSVLGESPSEGKNKLQKDTEFKTRIHASVIGVSL